jgi:hypothetical protein
MATPGYVRPSTPPQGDQIMEAYCLKCRTKREMKDEKQITMKNGKPATQGVCPVCGTKMFKIGAGGAAAAAGASGSTARASSSQSRSRK